MKTTGKSIHSLERWVVIPAAGLSHRMKQFKPLLPWRLPDGMPGTVIEAVTIQALSWADGGVVVVIGHRGDEIRRKLDAMPVHLVNNTCPDAPMSTSVALAVRLVPETAHILLWPGDHPAVQRETLDILKRRHQAHPEMIHGVSYQDRHGHPTLFPPAARQELLRPDKERGVRSLLTGDPIPVEWIQVPDPGVRINLDTPEDYERARAIFTGGANFQSAQKRGGRS